MIMIIIITTTTKQCIRPTLFRFSDGEGKRQAAENKTSLDLIADIKTEL
jgi:hypothetical protein